MNLLIYEIRNIHIEYKLAWHIFVLICISILMVEVGVLKGQLLLKLIPFSSISILYPCLPMIKNDILDGSLDLILSVKSVQFVVIIKFLSLVFNMIGPLFLFLIFRTLDVTHIFSLIVIFIQLSALTLVMSIISYFDKYKFIAIVLAMSSLLIINFSLFWLLTGSLIIVSVCLILSMYFLKNIHKKKLMVY